MSLSGTNPPPDRGAGLALAPARLRPGRLIVTSPTPGPLLSARAALLMLLAVLVGLAAGALTFLGGRSAPSAVLAGGTAAGAGLLFFSKLIGT